MSFRALTDWADGDPPMPGLWLTQGRGAPFENMLRWDGSKWYWLDGIPVTEYSWPYAERPKWRGLAFNPESARQMRLTFGVAPSGEQRVQSGYFVERVD